MNSGEQQLLADLKDTFSEFKCTLQDLRNPTEEFVINFYSYFLQEFEVDINNINQTQFSQAAIVNAYHDAYSGAIPKINMLNSIRAFNIIKDFGMLDIVSPAPRRTQEILRAFINFYNWSDQRVSNIRDKKIKLFERQNMMTEMRNVREQLRENLNSITKEIPNIRDAKIQLEEQLVALQENLTDLRLEKNTYKEKSDEMADKLGESEATLQKLAKEDSMLNSKIKDLSNQIVDSPSAVLFELDNIRQKHDEISEHRDQKRDLVEKKMEAKELQEKMLKEQEERIVLLNDLLKLIDQLREFNQAASVAEKNTSASQEHLTELKASLLAKSNRKQNCQEKLQALYLKWKTLKPQLTENLEYALKDLKDKKKEKDKMISSLKEDSAIQEKIDFNLQQIKTTIENVVHDYRKLQIQENLIHEQIKQNLERNMEALVKEAEKKTKKKKKNTKENNG